jgi:hypothetical protein
MTIILLGPQRFRMSARAAVRALEVERPIAAINAGWQERESEDAELNEVLDGRMRNLRLHARLEEMLEADPEYADAARVHHQMLDEQQALYTLRLERALDATYTIWRREGPTHLHNAALEDAIAGIRELDAWHLRRADQMEAEFEAAYQPLDRPAAVHHRTEVAQLLSECGALVITGGHVGVLQRCLQLFLELPRPDVPVVAWSAGAMAIGERIVLFADDAVQGSGHPEVYRRGLALYKGVIPLPHARRRLRLGDQVRVAAFARRFADACCLVLDEGARVPLPAGGGCPPGVPVLSPTGQVTTVEAA